MKCTAHFISRANLNLKKITRLSITIALNRSQYLKVGPKDKEVNFPKIYSGAVWKSMETASY